MPVILDIWTHVAPQFGGVGPSAAALAGAVEGCSGWSSNLLAVCDPNEPGRHVDIPAKVSILARKGFRPIVDLSLITPLKAALASSHVCHVHGIWDAHSLAVSRLAQRLGKPIVSSVHGMLEEWELHNKRLKKQVYAFLFERPSLALSSCLRALSEREATEYRRFGLKNPIAIVPNGVKTLARANTAELLSGHPQLAGKRIVLFMARLHYKKGILNLLRAWPSVVKLDPDAHLLIAGSNFEGTEQSARLLVSESKMDRSVTFCGVLNGNLKLGALSAASLFCLPSYSEGMSISVLEALSIGLPVVITPACNIDGVAESGAGFLTSNEPAALSAALVDGLSLTCRQWQSMSDAARSLARNRYSWNHLGAAMQSVYEWLLGGPKPGCVVP